MLGGLVLLAALHTALGSPLGPGWNRELWEVVRGVLYFTPLTIPLAVGVHRVNARLEEAQRRPPDKALVRGQKATTGPRPITGSGAGYRRKLPPARDEES